MLSGGIDLPWLVAPSLESPGVWISRQFHFASHIPVQVREKRVTNTEVDKGFGGNIPASGALHRDQEEIRQKRRSLPHDFDPSFMMRVQTVFAGSRWFGN